MKYECLQITFTFSLQVLIVAEESSVKRVISGGEQVDVGQGQQQEEHSNLEKGFRKMNTILFDGAFIRVSIKFLAMTSSMCLVMTKRMNLLSCVLRSL